METEQQHQAESGQIHIESGQPTHTVTQTEAAVDQTARVTDHAPIRQADHDHADAAILLSDASTVFDRAYNEALVHQIVVAYQANARGGNRAQKDRSQVKHSTKKPWKQKGTGRARAGMTSSPLWRGGGKVFPSSPEENFTHKINKKMYRAGMCTILSQLARENRIVLVDTFTLDTPKTQQAARKLRDLGLESVLIIMDNVNKNVYLATRNLPNVGVVASRDIDPLSLIYYKKVLLTKPAVAQIKEMLG